MIGAISYAQLLVPHRYLLKTKRANEAPYTLTGYDLKNSGESKDMLELILRSSGYGMSEFAADGQYDPKKMREYIDAVGQMQDCNILGRDLLFRKEICQIFARNNQRCAEFAPEVANDATSYACKQGERYLLICSDGTIETQHEINKWQVYYINISNIIASMGPDAEIIEKSWKIYDYYVDFIRRCGRKRKTAEVEEKEIMDQIEKKISLVDVEKYKQLLSNDSGDLFQTAQKEATIKAAYEEYIKVEIDSKLFVFNTRCKYYCRINRYGNFSKESIADVKQVTIRGNNKSQPELAHPGFAHPGFIYNDIVYKIANQRYDNMYSYIESGHGDVSMLPKDLVELAKSIRREVDELPEIDNFCDVSYNCTYNKEYIEIAYKQKTIRTYFEFEVGFGDCKYVRGAHEYVVSNMAVGKYEGKCMLFLKIGSQLFMIEKIPTNIAGEILIQQRLANSNKYRMEGQKKKTYLLPKTHPNKDMEFSINILNKVLLVDPDLDTALEAYYLRVRIERDPEANLKTLTEKELSDLVYFSAKYLLSCASPYVTPDIKDFIKRIVDLDINSQIQE